MPYDINGNGVGPKKPRTRAKKALPPWWPHVFIFACALVAGLAFWHMISWTNDCYGTSVHHPTMDCLTYTYVNDSSEPPIFVYVVTDPDTDVEYLVTDRGGITPRIGGTSG